MKHLLLALVALCAPVSAQQGTVVLEPSYWVARNVSDLLPPPDPFMVGVEISVELSWRINYECEIGAMGLDPNGTILGHFDSTLNFQKYWKLEAHEWGNPSASLVFAGSRGRPVNLTLSQTFWTPTTWDGLIDWQGPTWQRVTAAMPSQSRQVAIPLSLLQTRDLWVNTYAGAGTAMTGYQSDGHPWYRILDPWQATVTYRYF